MFIVLWIIACILIADFLSGFIHWLEDAYGNPNWPIVGPHVAAPNIFHHKSPRKFIHASFFKRNISTFVVTVLLAGIVGLFIGFTWQLGLIAILGGMANEVHAYAHRRKDETPWFIKLLHKLRIMQSPRHHSIHHHSPYDTYYCILTPWLNPIFDKIRFWDHIENFLKLFGIKPLRGHPDREGY